MFSSLGVLKTPAVRTINETTHKASAFTRPRMTVLSTRVCQRRDKARETPSDEVDFLPPPPHARLPRYLPSSPASRGSQSHTAQPAQPDRAGPQPPFFSPSGDKLSCTPPRTFCKEGQLWAWRWPECGRGRNKLALAAGLECGCWGVEILSPSVVDTTGASAGLSTAGGQERAAA